MTPRSPRPACTSSPPTPASTSKAASRRTTRSASRSTPAPFPARPQIGKLDLNASIVGPASSPIAEGSFDAGDIHVEQGSLDHVSATFRAVPNGPLNQEATRIAFEGQGAMSGLALADPALASAIGSEAKLSLRGSAIVGGDIVVRYARTCVA